jgi:hypothetical protein
MEQRDDLAAPRINPSQIGTFVLVAMQARQGQILQGGSSPVLSRYDVVHMKEPAYADAGMWQYSHRRFARAQTARISP